MYSFESYKAAQKGTLSSGRTEVTPENLKSLRLAHSEQRKQV